MIVISYIPSYVHDASALLVFFVIACFLQIITGGIFLLLDSQKEEPEELIEPLQG